MSRRPLRDHDGSAPRWPLIAGALALLLLVAAGSYLAGSYTAAGSPAEEPEMAVSSGIVAAPEPGDARGGEEEPPEPAHPAGIDPEAFYVLENAHSGRVIDVSGMSADNGAPIHQWDRHDQANQQWRFAPVEEGYYELVSRNSGKLAQISVDAEPGQEAAVQLTRTGQANQHWAVAEAGDGLVRLVNRHTSQVLEARDGAQDNGVVLTQGPDGGHPHQQWRLIRIE